MTQRKTAIFDLDGTLTDSKPGILRCLHEALEAHDIHWEGSLDWFIGPPALQSMERLMPEADEAQRAALLLDYRARYTDGGWAENAVYPGIPELLQKLQQEGWQLFICTSKRADFALKILDRFDLQRYFIKVYAEAAESKHHSKAELLGRLIVEQGIDAVASYMIGDRNFDIEAAKANGVRSIAVTYGYGSREELDAVSPDVICNSTVEIGSALLEI